MKRPWQWFARSQSTLFALVLLTTILFLSGSNWLAQADSAFYQALAGLFQHLQDRSLIQPLEARSRIALSTGIIVVLLLLYPRLPPSTTLLTTASLIITTLLISELMLIHMQLWFPPSAVVATLLLAYPLWSWRRLETMTRFINQELKRLGREPALETIAPVNDLEEVMAFVTAAVPLKGWVLYQGGRRLVAWGTAPQPMVTSPCTRLWSSLKPRQYWLAIDDSGGQFALGVAMKNDQAPTLEQQRVLLSLARAYWQTQLPDATSDNDQFSSRIRAVEAAVSRMHTMQHFIQSSLNQMADGVVVINQLGQTLLANDKALAYLALDHEPETLSGWPVMQLLDKLTLVQGHDKRKLLARALTDEEGIQARGTTPDGRDILIQTAPLSLGDEETLGLVINLSDITHLMNIERERAETVRFLSHDLRAPLVSLLSLTTLADSDRENFDREEFIQRVEHYTQRTLELANDFLALSRIENHADLNFTRIDLGDVIYSAVDAMWEQAKVKGITLSNTTPEKALALIGVPDILERVLINLIGNAIKYCPEQARIEIGADRSNDQLHCYVRDNGPGIPAIELPKLFERFYRGRHGRHDGSGLGLAFVKAAIEKHGGRICVSSEEGKDTCFRITLPACQSMRIGHSEELNKSSEERNKLSGKRDSLFAAL